MTTPTKTVDFFTRGQALDLLQIIFEYNIEGKFPNCKELYESAFLYKSLEHLYRETFKNRRNIDDFWHLCVRLREKGYIERWQYKSNNIGKISEEGIKWLMHFRPSFAAYHVNKIVNDNWAMGRPVRF